MTPDTIDFDLVGIGDRAVDYLTAWDLQRRVHQRVVDAESPDTVLLLEHPPTFTAGKRTDPHERPLDPGGAPVIDVDRGGKITFHGPGQLVAYPVVRLAGPRHVVPYVRALEAAAIRAVAALGVTATRREGLTGVWVGREKLVAIGVRVAAGGITSHGLALNVDPDLTHFSGIVPCGLASEGVCSLASLGIAADMPAARDALADALVAGLGGRAGGVRGTLAQEVTA